MTFLTLPAELRLEIYSHILSRTSLQPKPSELREFQGLPLACRDIYNEFAGQVTKRVMRFLDSIQENWPAKHESLVLVVDSQKRMISPKIYIGISHDYIGRPDDTMDATLDNLISTLLDNLSRFGLHVRDPPHYSLPRPHYLEPFDFISTRLDSIRFHRLMEWGREQARRSNDRTGESMRFRAILNSMFPIISPEDKARYGTVRKDRDRKLLECVHGL
ncbi:hypothetical protein PTNB73_03988 [Pyrenophora teres f. teres]|nr:hypothetical protein PTNB85_05339 [Pyrenophora teres f. teres]KAE8868935.1 hypothetical protein PTNB73_03988 [Pyrenophora teres f. teres]